MKKKLLGLMFIACGAVGFTQTTIGNSSFENWYDLGVKDSLDFWMTSTQEYQQNGWLDAVNSYQISASHSGSSAIHMETILRYDSGSGQNDTLFGYAIKSYADGNGFEGFPYADTVDVFTCWYKCGIVPGDQGLILIEMSKNDVVYSTTTYPIVGNQGTWTQLTIPLVAGGAMAPDSVFIGFVSSNPMNPGNAEEGSWLEIDDIDFDFLGGSVIPADIPNKGFEDWTYETIEQPTDWFSFDQLLYPMTASVYATKSTTASDGLASLQIETTFETIMTGIPAIVTNGYFDPMVDSIIGGTPFIAQPATIGGVYQFSPTFTDTAFVFVDFWNSVSGLHTMYIDTLLDAAVWTPWSIDLTFTEAPDSVLIYFFSGANLGSTLLVDAIQVAGGDLGVTTQIQSGFMIYPNPSSTSATIQFETADQIRIFDLSGKLVGIYSVSGDSALVVNTADLENGTYIVQLLNNGKTTAERLVVQH